MAKAVWIAQHTGAGLIRTILPVRARNSHKGDYGRVLLLCGSEDKVNLKASEKLEKLLPDAKLKIIENAGHELNSDAPEALACALAEFFKR